MVRSSNSIDCDLSAPMFSTLTHILKVTFIFRILNSYHAYNKIWSTGQLWIALFTVYIYRKRYVFILPIADLYCHNIFCFKKSNNITVGIHNVRHHFINDAIYGNHQPPFLLLQLSQMCHGICIIGESFKCHYSSFRQNLRITELDNRFLWMQTIQHVSKHCKY